MRAIRRTGWIVLFVGTLVLTARPVHADQPKRTSGAVRAGQLSPETSPEKAETKAKATDHAVRLHFEVVELQLSDEQVKQIDQSTRPVDTDALLAESLKEGTARVKHVFDTPLVVAQPVKLTNGTRMPFVTGASVDAQGGTRSQVQYEDVGCTVEIKTDWVGPSSDGLVHAQWDVEISDLIVDTPIQLAANVAAPMFTNVNQQFSAVHTVGVPLAFSTLSSHRFGTEPENRATVYVYHVCFEPLDAGP